MATNSINIESDINHSARVHAAIENGLPATSTIPKPLNDTPFCTAVAPMTAAIDAQSTGEDVLCTLRTRHMGQFADLPMELLVMVAKNLFTLYRNTRPVDTGGMWWDIKFPKETLDVSFFAARRVSRTMRNASRQAFFDDMDLATPWLKRGIDAMDRRIDTEEKYAKRIVQLQSSRNLRCTACGVKMCMVECHSSTSVDKLYHWNKIQQATGQNLIDVYRDYTHHTSCDPEMLFNKGFRLEGGRRQNRYGVWYTNLYTVCIKDEEENLV